MASGFQAGLDTGMNFVGRLKEWMAGSGVDLLTNLLVSAVILLVGWVVIRLVDKALRKAMARANRKVLLVNFIVSVVTKVGWAILLVTILSRLGVDVTPLIAGLGVTGFILGFAFQESLGNLASGLMIAVNEPFKVGDVVDAAGHTGSVLEVNMMATVMLTPDNKRIVLPNKGVWGGPIVNYSAMDTRRVDLQVGIAYGEDVEKAVSVIRDAVRHGRPFIPHDHAAVRRHHAALHRHARVRRRGPRAGRPGDAGADCGRCRTRRQPGHDQRPSLGEERRLLVRQVRDAADR